MAANTKAVYKNAMDQFNDFRQQYKFEPIWPVPLTQLQTFISYLFHNGYAYSTVVTYMSALKFQHKIHGLQEYVSHFTVSKMLEGYRRSKPTHDSRLPITYDILVEICAKLDAVCNSAYEATLFKAAYTLAFFGLFRVGELVFSSSAMGDAPLFHSDIVQLQVDQSFMVRLRKSKSNQHGVPILVPIVATGTSVCPVVAMVTYLNIRPKAIAQYLFCHIDGSPLTRYQFGAVLTKVILRSKFQPTISGLFKSHSFRIGAATWLAQQGIPNAEIKKAGRWSSDAYLRYIRLT